MDDQVLEIAARDQQAETYDEWYTRKGRLYGYIEERAILKALNPKKDDVILDAGCGTGRFSRLLAGKCKKVHSLDFSSKSLDILKRRSRLEGIKNIEPKVFDITQKFQLDEKVDKIISIQVIQHLPTEEMRVHALKNMRDTLKEGGKCLITVYNWNRPSKNGLKKEGIFSNGIYYKRFTPDEARSLMEKGGFSVKSITGIINLAGYPNIFNVKNIFLLFYPVALADTIISGFESSTSLGDFLLCEVSR
jgi:SAM-dependent methyltransferase